MYPIHNFLRYLSLFWHQVIIIKKIMPRNETEKGNRITQEKEYAAHVCCVIYAFSFQFWLLSPKGKKREVKKRSLKSLEQFNSNGILFLKLFRPSVRKNVIGMEAICKNSEITRTIYSNSERLEQFLKQNVFLNKVVTK